MCSKCMRQPVRWAAVVVMSLAVASLPAAAAIAQPEDEKISYELRQALTEPLVAKLKQLGDSKNAEGTTNKRGVYSKDFRKMGESTYAVTFHVDTAGDTTLTTQRLLLTLKPETPGSEKWAIASEEVQDTYDGLRRQLGGRCYPFGQFAFDRHGLELSASGGAVCEYYFEDAVSGFEVVADNLSYTYRAPEYNNFYALQAIHQQDFSKELEFQPQRFEFSCDAMSCEELLAEAFTGLERQPPPAPGELGDIESSAVASNLLSRVAEGWKKAAKERRESAFAHFRSPDLEGNRRYTIRVEKAEKASVGIRYNNWDGFEVEFWVEVNRPDTGHTSFTLFGYYTDETLQKFPPYELERRDDLQDRWHEVYRLKGDLEIALGDDEKVSGDIRYGITLKENLRVLPFFIATKQIGIQNADTKKPQLSVNSIQLDGEELTWVRTGPYTGLIVLPEEMSKGTQLDLRMTYDSQVIHKLNHSYSRMLRSGWLPLVRIFDMIDEFELTIRHPSKYTLLGIGKKTWEKQEGDVTIAHWVAENPVEFPSIIFGKYFSDKPGFDAKKLDGTVIPIGVHVDEVSMGQLDIELTSAEKAEDTAEGLRIGARGIRGKQLRSIAEQAANAINLFAAISGVDYPYGELNLVADPEGMMYGQAPSSLIYLGFGVFRGEGTMAGDSLLGGGGTGTAKFLKSVVAHEVGHQWWGSRVCNSNGRNYWFVESLAEYFSALYLEAVFGPKEYQEQVDEWRNTILAMDAKSSVQNASALFPGNDGFGSYVAAVYNRGPYAFHILRQIFGEEKFFEFWKEFTEKLTLRGEIVTRDIQTVAEEVLGGVDQNGQPYNVDLDWFFDQWIRGVGIPQYRLVYDVRNTEDGGAIIEGTVYQRVLVGNRYKQHILDGAQYRAVVPLTVIARKGKEYKKKLLVEGAETTFKLKVPERPLDVVLNKYGETLAHDVVTNKSW